ncbi:SRPBCC family protein [Ancylobacter defluvii]|uniref:Activator of HSP90 ATPase n=1 Tax=Ancylobacter defluvii TaxID=1282440 RepID=A0A9W6ND63_9HYPH|nr:SRPBCC domain-containing protein [Ancylobacter defluvii]MBS7588186.1 SRPBCC domain-containing protein [Ancylobacter defluvii]GLK86578.1 activator of HSP90 ATPase [Ancylobacter defluvii]
MSAQMPASDQSSTAPVFTIVRRFAAPRPLVWRAWTEAGLLGAWFGPKGAKTTVLSQDLRPGGRLHGRMEIAEHGVVHFRFVYREIAAPERLVWVHSFADAAGEVVSAPFLDAWPRELVTTVHFEEAAAATRVTLTSEPLGASAAEIAAFIDLMQGMEAGWGGGFETLDGLLAKLGG